MYIFISSETSKLNGSTFRKIRNDIDKKLLFLTNREKQEELKQDSSYGSEFNDIGIIMMILSPDFDHYKERKLIRFKEKWADIRLKIDYQKYQNSDDKVKFLLILKNIVDSIMVVENRKRGDFQGLKLIDDILNALNVTKEELKDL